MKKLLAITFSLLLTLTLAACSSATTEVSNASEVIMSGDGISYTKQDFFIDLMKNDYESILLTDLTEKIATFEEVDFDSIQDEVDAYFASLKDSYGDSYDAMMTYYGGEEYFRTTIEASYLLDDLVQKYCDYNFDTLLSTYEPTKAKIVSFASEDEAKAMITDIEENGTSFEDAAANAGYEETVSEEIYTTSSDIHNTILNYFIDATETGLSTTPVVCLTDTTNSDGEVVTDIVYYVVEITDLDANNFKDEFYTEISSDIDTDTVFSYYFTKYNVEVYDQDVYELLKETYEGIN